jgi:hypothetical protein
MNSYKNKLSPPEVNRSDRFEAVKKKIIDSNGKNIAYGSIAIVL